MVSFSEIEPFARYFIIICQHQFWKALNRSICRLVNRIYSPEPRNRSPSNSTTIKSRTSTRKSPLHRSSSQVVTILRDSLTNSLSEKMIYDPKLKAQSIPASQPARAPSPGHNVLISQIYIDIYLPFCARVEFTLPASCQLDK